MLAPDRVAIFEISFLGDIAYTPDAEFFFRKTEGEGDLDLYMSKMLGHKPKPKEKRQLVCNMYKAHFRAITKHYKARRAWPALMLSCIYALRTAYKTSFIGKLRHS
jgi:hypothetical protein